MSAEDLVKFFNKVRPTVIISVQDQEWTTDTIEVLKELRGQGAEVVHLGPTSEKCHQHFLIKDVDHCRGDLSVWCVSPEIRQAVKDWSWDGDKYLPPKTWRDIRADESFMNLNQNIRMKAEANALTRVALAGEIAEEEAYESRGCTLDVPDTDDEMTAAEVETRDIQETEHLEEIPVPHQGQVKRKERRFG